MLWAITSYFNPVGYKSRLANYRTFRKFLAAPLLAVELSFTGSFELQPGDADILVQLTGGDVLWQKERLLNVGLRHLPPDCDAVAWLDCDVVFSNDRWSRQARDALSRFSLVQLFSERCNLARDARLDSTGWSPVESRRRAIGQAIAAGQLKPDDLRVAGASVVFGAPTPGLAWAARRTLLDKHGLYDRRIVGAGDRAMICAAVGRPDYCVTAQAMTGRAAEHYLAWAEPFSADVGGRISYVEGLVFHLWHGSSRGSETWTARAGPGRDGLRSAHRHRRQRYRLLAMEFQQARSARVCEKLLRLAQRGRPASREGGPCRTVRWLAIMEPAKDLARFTASGARAPRCAR